MLLAARNCLHWSMLLWLLDVLLHHMQLKCHDVVRMSWNDDEAVVACAEAYGTCETRTCQLVVFFVSNASFHHRLPITVSYKYSISIHFLLDVVGISMYILIYPYHFVFLPYLSTMMIPVIVCH